MKPKLETTFTPSFEDYKKLASEFFKRLKATPRPTDDQVHGGLRCLRIAYLDLDCTELERHGAVIVLQMADRKAYELTGNPNL